MVWAQSRSLAGIRAALLCRTRRQAGGLAAVAGRPARPQDHSRLRRSRPVAQQRRGPQGVFGREDRWKIEPQSWQACRIVTDGMVARPPAKMWFPACDRTRHRRPRCNRGKAGKKIGECSVGSFQFSVELNTENLITENSVRILNPCLRAFFSALRAAARRSAASPES